MISDILALWNFIDKELDHASVFSTLFDAEGRILEGSEIVKINLHKAQQNSIIWFYEVVPYKDFVFVPFPVNPALFLDYGLLNNSSNPDAKLFRFVSSPLSRYSAGGEPNVKVDFMIFGYKPSDLMNRKKV
jgi:hypothetical protein